MSGKDEKEWRKVDPEICSGEVKGPRHGKGGNSSIFSFLAPMHHHLPRWKDENIESVAEDKQKKR